MACDGTSPKRGWCARSVGHLDNGRLLDPRLDLAGCATATGDPIAFAWVEPTSGTRFVAVQQDGFVEVYPVLADLPIRVSTTRDIDASTSTATFAVSEHDRVGRIIRSYVLVARVAG